MGGRGYSSATARSGIKRVGGVKGYGMYEPEFYNHDTQGGHDAIHAFMEGRYKSGWTLDPAAEFEANRLGVTKSEALDMVDAVNNYTNWSYGNIRKTQRKNAGQYTETDKKYLKAQNEVEKYIAFAPKWYGGKTYRGVALNDSALAGLKKGSVVDMGGTSSWSSRLMTAQAFADDNAEHSELNRVVFQSGTQQRGTSVTHISQHRFENEVLVSKYARYKVNKVTKKKGITYVDVEEL